MFTNIHSVTIALFDPRIVSRKRNKKNTKNILRGYQKLINGNVSEFVNHIYYGDELWFRFKENKFFLEG